MQWCFMHKGEALMFSADANGIPGFCAGSYYWNFSCRSRPTERFVDTWTRPFYYDNPLPDVKALFEAMLEQCGCAIVMLCDVSEYNVANGEDGSGVAYHLFKDIREGVVEGNFSYVVEHSPEMFNWNSGNKVVVMTARLTDLRNRWTPPDDDHGCSCCYDDE